MPTKFIAKKLTRFLEFLKEYRLRIKFVKKRKQLKKNVKQKKIKN